MKRLMQWLVLLLALVVGGCTSTSKESEVDTTFYVQRLLDFKEGYKDAVSYANDLYADEVAEAEYIYERYQSKWNWLFDLEEELEDKIIESPNDEEEEYNRRLTNAFEQKYYKELDEKEADWNNWYRIQKNLDQKLNEEIISYLADRYHEDYFEIDYDDVVFSKEGYAYFLNYDAEAIASSYFDLNEAIAKYYENNEMEVRLTKLEEQKEEYKGYFSVDDEHSTWHNYHYDFIGMHVMVEMEQHLLEKMGIEQYVSFLDEEGDFDQKEAVSVLMGDEYVDSDGQPSELYNDFRKNTENYLSQQFDTLLSEDEQLFYADYVVEDYNGNVKEAWLKRLQVYNEEGDYLALMIKPYEIIVDEDSTISPFVCLIIDSKGGELQVLNKFVGFDEY